MSELSKPGPGLTAFVNSFKGPEEESSQSLEEMLDGIATPEPKTFTFLVGTKLYNQLIKEGYENHKKNSTLKFSRDRRRDKGRSGQ